MTITVELKNIRTNESLSEETHAYSADLYIDGVNIGHVHNHGQGGCDEYHPAKGFTYETYSEADKRCKEELPPVDMSKYGIEETMTTSLEIVCGDLVNAFVVEKALKRALSRTLIFTKPNEDGLFEVSKAKLGRMTPEQAIAHFKEKTPGVRFLNEMPLDEARRIYAAD